MRVGENTTLNTVRDSINQSRMRMNDLQKENATLKRVNAPHDDPVGNAKLMSIRNEQLDNTEFERNANLAKTFLNYTDSSLEEVTNLLVRAKELALGQASSAANGAESRAMVAEEIKNIQSEISSIANRRLGDRFIFSGYKTGTTPFDEGGNYSGDDGKIMVEVQKDVFVGMNVPGREIFLGAAKSSPSATQGREPASLEMQPKKTSESATAVGPEMAIKQRAERPDEDVFRTLDALRVGLMTNDVDQIRSTLDPLDKVRDRVITTRAQVGARMSGIDNAIANMGKRG
ncbi:MAG: flagellar hook-associated protein FlgL, partial [Bdellovibrionota bacterium]